ncbi:NTPase [Candidatus Bathyarchaeota archaeon]|nr:NTPase [Candidatus Bathyarchaeota archaeon]
MSKKIFLTGKPGVGKTSIMIYLIEELKRMGFKVGGFVSSEVRVKGERVGFKIKDLSSSKEGWLAHVNQAFGPKLGKYKVNLKDLIEVGVNSINEAEVNQDIDLIAIDELGPMEFFSFEFKKAVEKVVESEKPLIATIHYKLKNEFLKKVKNCKVFEVTLENRERLPKEVLKEVLTVLKNP